MQHLRGLAAIRQGFCMMEQGGPDQMQIFLRLIGGMKQPVKPAGCMAL